MQLDIDTVDSPDPIYCVACTYAYFKSIIIPLLSTIDRGGKLNVAARLHANVIFSLRRIFD